MSYLNINAEDGGIFQAYYSGTKFKAPGIILIQEIFGVNEVMRNIANDLSKLGYHVLCPDIFWRIEPGIDITDKTKKEWDKAFELFGKFDIDLGIKDLNSTLNYLRNIELCSGKVGSVGYCLGGKLSYLMACRTNSDCNVSYYGVGVDDLLNESVNIVNPYLSHIAENDSFVSKKAQELIKNNLSNNSYCDIKLYPDEEHAFARIGGEHFSESSSKLANSRTNEFFKKHLN